MNNDIGHNGATLHISHQGDTAIRVQFLEDDLESRWNRTRRLVSHLERVSLPAVYGVAGTYDSVLIEFDGSGISAENLAAVIEFNISFHSDAEIEQESSRRYNLPVLYGGEMGPDIAEVAEIFELTEEELVAKHTSMWYRIRSFGAPAASPLMDGLDDATSVPRRRNPRVRVGGGSVAFAGTQSIIYSVGAPGGWLLIGRTPIELVSTTAEQVCVYRPSDYFSYFSITLGEWDSYLGNTLEGFRV